MSLFQPGELAIHIPTGIEVEVLGPITWLDDAITDDGGARVSPGLVYPVRVGNDDELYCSPQDLQKKQPPGDARGVCDWDSCPWQPAKAGA